MNGQISRKANSTNVNQSESELIASYTTFLDCNEPIGHHSRKRHFTRAWSDTYISVFRVQLLVHLINCPRKSPDKLICI
jgi:hypothetical protein